MRHRREHVGVEHRAHVVGHVVVHPVGVDDPLALAEDDVALHVELQRRALVLRRSARQVGLLQAGGPDHQPIGRDVERADLAAAMSVDDDVHPGIDHRDPLVAGRIGEPLGLHGHVAAGKDANPPPPADDVAGPRAPAGRRHAAPASRPAPATRHRARASCPPAWPGRPAAGRGELRLLHRRPPAVFARFGAPPLHAPPIDRRQHVRLAGRRSPLGPARRRCCRSGHHVWSVNRGARPTAGDTSTSPSRYAMTLSGRGSVGLGPVDPQDGLAAAGVALALLNHAVAAEHPNFVAPGCHWLPAWAVMAIGSAASESGSCTWAAAGRQ